MSDLIDLVKGHKENTTGYGYIYILLNPSFSEDVVKIGMTSRSPVLRSLELSSHTGVPEKFILAYSERVQSAKTVERMAHDALQQYRVDPGREFFRVPLSEAINTIRQIVENTSKPRSKRQKHSNETTCRRCGLIFLPSNEYKFCPKCFPD